MQDQDVSIETMKTQIGFVGKVLFSLLFLILVITVAYYKGIFLGIVAGVLLSWWLYRHVFRYQVKTKVDLLYEQELSVQREVMRPYVKPIIFAFLGVVFLNGVVYFTTGNRSILFLIDFLFLFFGIVFMGSIHAKNRREKGLMDRATVSKEMGFVFSPVGDITGIHEKLRGLGKDSRISNIYSGVIEGYPIKIFDFYCVWMKNASYETTILEITNSRRFPNILIVSKSDTFGETFDMTTVFPGIPTILEGDFSDHFSLFVEDGTEAIVRQFLTPDLMAALIDTMPELSFLFFDTKLYVVLSNNAESSFSQDRFTEQVNKARFVLSKWSQTLSRLEA